MPDATRGPESREFERWREPGSCGRRRSGLDDAVVAGPAAAVTIIWRLLTIHRGWTAPMPRRDWHHRFVIEEPRPDEL